MVEPRTNGEHVKIKKKGRNYSVEFVVIKLNSMENMKQGILLSLVLVSCFLSFPTLLRSQDDSVNERVLYVVFDDYTYSLNSIALDGKSETFLAETNSEWFTLSPRGDRLLFLREHEEVGDDIYLVDMNSSNILKLTKSGNNSQPVWSPSSDKIAFLTKENNKFAIYTLDLSGIDANSQNVPNPVRLLNTEQMIGELVWSSNSQSLAFTQCDENWDCDIYIVNTDGTTVENITPDFQDSVASFAWSSTVEKLAFIAYRRSDYQMADLYTIDLGTHMISRVSPSSAGYMSLSWSPDGKSLAFTSDMDGDWDIYILNNLENAPIAVTVNDNLQDGFYGIDWSSDSSQLAYSSGPIDGNFQIFIMQQDGSHIKQLTHAPSHAISPKWLISRS